MWLDMTRQGMVSQHFGLEKGIYFTQNKELENVLWPHGTCIWDIKKCWIQSAKIYINNKKNV